mgnify:CR=1 FL=1
MVRLGFVYMEIQGLNLCPMHVAYILFLYAYLIGYFLHISRSVRITLRHRISSVVSPSYPLMVLSEDGIFLELSNCSTLDNVRVFSV